jgi:hypothetical protein
VDIQALKGEEEKGNDAPFKKTSFTFVSHGTEK